MFLRALRVIQLVVCILFTLLYCLATREVGNRDGQDSVVYKGTAVNIYYKQRIVDADNDPLLYHAPLYPLILAAGVPFLPTYIWFLHLLTACGTFCIWLRIASDFFRNRKLLWAFGLALALSTPMLMIAVLVWSEMIFLFLLSVYLYYLHLFFREGREKWMYLAAAVGMLVLLQRNAGIFLFAGVYVGLLLVGVLAKPPRLRLRTFLLSGFISLAGFACWNVRNIIYYNNPRIVKELLPYWTPFRNLVIVLGELGKNFVPGQLWDLAGVVVALGLTLWVAYQFFFKPEHRAPLPMLLLYTLLVYLLTWLIIPPAENNISRFMAVILPVFYFLMLLALQNIRVGTARLTGTLVRILVVLFYSYSLLRVLTNACNWGNIPIF